MQSKLTLSPSFTCLAMTMLLFNSHSIAASPEIHTTAQSTWTSNNTPFVANSWMIAGVCLVVLLIGYWGFRIYKIETPGIVFTKGASFTPIGGWLILVIIGLIGTAASAIFELVNGHYFAVSKWNTFITGSISVGYRMFLIFKVLEYIFIACYAVFCFILMLRKRDILPKYIIGFYISTPIFFIVNYIITSCLKFDSSNLELPLIRSIVISGIWISYFKRSVRVQQTFIVPYPAHNYSYEEEEDQHQQA